MEFGHKFADRCGHNTERDANERSPVFFQWLDAVHQVMSQFPSAFEFNEFFLVLHTFFVLYSEILRSKFSNIFIYCSVSYYVYVIVKLKADAC